MKAVREAACDGRKKRKVDLHECGDEHHYVHKGKGGGGHLKRSPRRLSKCALGRRGGRRGINSGIKE